MHPPRRRPQISAKLAPLHSARACNSSTLEASGSSCFPRSDSFCTVVQQRVSLRRLDRAVPSGRSQVVGSTCSRGDVAECHAAVRKLWVFDVVEIRGADGTMYRLFPPQHAVDASGQQQADLARLVPIAHHPRSGVACQSVEETEADIEPVAYRMSWSVALSDKSRCQSADFQSANRQEPAPLAEKLSREPRGLIGSGAQSAFVPCGTDVAVSVSDGGFLCNPQCGDGLGYAVGEASHSSEGAESIVARMGRLPLGRQRELLDLLEALECAG
mmetsp:Transcript_999/g.2036  ORF Transcript_999/g.2036 Transcript_999/m.2036 type:complete len:272 (-) Transcript_999:144-959(-)